MKTKITALALVAVSALALAPKPAQAGDKEVALIGGFIGGLIVGTAINNDHRGYAPPVETVVVHDRGYGYGRHHAPPPPRGYWKEVTVRRWVPDTWEYRYEYGRRVRVYVPGHYVIDRDRVWVAYDSPRYGRGHGPRRW